MSGLGPRSLLDPPPQRIAVLRALHLGDLLCALPALRALRAAAPESRVTLIGLPWARDFARRYPQWIDEFAEFPAGDGFLEGRSSRPPAAFVAAQRGRYDMTIQLHGSGERSNALMAALGAARNAGYHLAGALPPGAGFLAWRPDEGEIARWLRLLHHLGAPDTGSTLAFPLRPAECREALRLLAGTPLQDGGYVCLHPGARLASRRWSLASFAEVGAALLEEGGSLLLTGSADEAPLTHALRRKLGRRHADRILDSAGRTSLGGLAALVAGARMVLCNDTGISHVAAATGTPSVIVSSGGDAARWAPLNRRRHRVLAHQTACRPCLHAVCPYDHECATAIEPAAVLAAVRELLEDYRHAA